MARYFYRQILALLGGIIFASLAIFFVLRLLPGDAATVLAGTNTNNKQVESLRQNLGLNDPIITQYFNWIRDFFTMNLEDSLVSGESVIDRVSSALSISFPLAIMSFSLALAVALPLGVYSAYAKYNRRNFMVNIVFSFIIGVPILWSALIVISLSDLLSLPFSNQGFPDKAWADPLAAFNSLVLPAISIAIIESAILFRFIKTVASEYLDSELFYTYLNAGVKPWSAAWRASFSLVMLRILGVLGVQFAALLAGVVVIEQLYNLPGIGAAMVSDVASRDFLLLQSEIFCLSIIILLLGFISDFLAKIIDPRVRTSFKNTRDDI